MHSGWPSRYDAGRAGGAVNVFMGKVIPQTLAFLEEEYGFPHVVEDDYVSKSSVVFHRHDPVKLRRMEMLLYRNISEECPTSDE